MAEDVDVGFGKLVERAVAENSLGDFTVVNSLLRTFAHEALTSQADGADAFAEELDRSSRELAKVFLGQGDYTASEWNGPGQIDVYLARQEGVESDDPVERVAGALVNMVLDLMQLGESMGSDNALNEQWQPQANQIINDYAHEFMGLPTSGFTPPKNAKEQAVSRPKIKPSRLRE